MNQQRNKKTSDDTPTLSRGETRGIIMTPPSTFPSTSSLSSYDYSVLYTVLSTTFFNVSHFPPSLKLGNTITTNLLLRSVKINIIQNHILLLTNMVQVQGQRETIHLTINKRHRQVKTRITVRTHHHQICQIFQSLLLFYDSS